MCSQKQTTMSTLTIEKVRNYQGQNRFINNLKASIQKYGSLTPKQLEAAEKSLNAPAKLDLENLPEDLKEILNYQGESAFIKDIAAKLKQWGTLTQKQKEAALNAIQSEKDAAQKYEVEWATPGETILVGRGIGEKLKEEYKLEFNPRILDITKILEIRPKALKIAAKMTEKRGKVCCVCNKTLTDELSMLTGVGKICSKKTGIPYLTDKSQAEMYRENYLKRINELGEFVFWIPKSQIKKWEGGYHKQMVDSIY